MSDAIKKVMDQVPRKQEFARHLPLPSVAMVAVSPKGHVLMARRSDTNPLCPGYLQFSGGMIELGETLEQAARREFVEETGITDFVYKGVLSVDSYYTEHTGHWVCTFVWLQVNNVHIPPNPEPDKSKDWAWYKPSELKPPHMHGMNEALEELTWRV